MQKFLLRAIVLGVIGIISALTASAQDTTKPTSVDPKLIEFQNAKVVKEYTIASIKITGIKFLDTAIVLSISGLQVGDKFMHPGSDIFAKAIANLWRQRLFSNVEIFVIGIEGENVSIEISLQERPRVGNLVFIGIKKSEAEDLQTKVSIAKQSIITENVYQNITETITKFYTEKGFMNVKIRIDEAWDTSFVNSKLLTVHIDKGNKVHINDINFFGNDNVDALKLKKQMKGTK